MKYPSENVVRSAARWLAAIGFIAAGANHFRNEDFYTRIVPPSFPNPRLLVQISGIAEIVGGVGIVVPRLRWASGWGLIALLIAVFPANVYMAMEPVKAAGGDFPRWMLYLRLPLQAVFIAWVAWVMKPDPHEFSPPRH